MERHNEDEKLYGHDFQRGLIRYFCQDAAFAMEIGLSVSAKVFSTKPLAFIFKILKNHFAEYQTEISQDTIRQEAREFVEKNKAFAGKEEEFYYELSEEIDLIFGTPFNEKYIRDKTKTFHEMQALRLALMEAAQLLQEGNTDKIYAAIEKSRVTIGTKDGLSFQHLFERRSKWVEDAKPQAKVPFGFQRLDRELQGGMGKGELHVILGATNAGKTTMGINIAATNICIGKRVFFASFESDEDVILKKLAVRLTGLDYGQIVDPKYKKDYEDKLIRFERDLPIHIQSWSPGTENANVIKSWVSKHRAMQGVTPDLIIVDYDDMLLPSTGKLGDLHQDGGTIYTDLMNVAKYFSCAVLVFAQADTPGIKKSETGERLLKSDISGSRRKIKDADSVLTINFRGEDDQNGYLWLDKVRHGANKFQVDITRDLTRCLIVERDQEPNNAPPPPVGDFEN